MIHYVGHLSALGEVVGFTRWILVLRLACNKYYTFNLGLHFAVEWMSAV